MTRDKENSGAAWPGIYDTEGHGPCRITETSNGVAYEQHDPGLSAREYAAIHTGTPDSGCDWIDEMIEKKNLRELTAAIAVTAMGDIDLGCQETARKHGMSVSVLIPKVSLGQAKMIIAELGGEG